jgi:hypothetical protein
MNRNHSRIRVPGAKPKPTPKAVAPAPAPAPAAAPEPETARIKEFCNNPAAASLLPHFNRWKILPHFPPNFLIYAGIIDLTRTKAYHRPFVTTKGLTKRADYFMDISGNQTLLKNISKIMFFYAEMVYIRAHIGDTLYLVATPTHMMSDIHKITTVAYKALMNPSPSTFSKRQIHWIYLPSTIKETEITDRVKTWLDLNPDYRVHVWPITDSPVYLAKHTNITIHDVADFRTTVFNWLEDHSSLWAEEMIAALWENRHDPHAARLISAYARNILLATQGGFYVDCAETVCLTPLAAILGSLGGFTAAADNTGSLGSYFMVAPTDGDWNDVVVKSVETVLSAGHIYEPDMTASNVDNLIFKSHLPRLHVALDLPVTRLPYCNLQRHGCLLSVIGHIDHETDKEKSLVESLLAFKN